MKIRGFFSALNSKKWLPKGLYWRTFLIIAFPLVLVQIVTAYVVYDRHLGSVTRTLASAVAKDIALCSREGKRDPFEAERFARTLDLKYKFYLHRRWPLFEDDMAMPWIDEYLFDALSKSLEVPFNLKTSDHTIHVAVKLPIGIAAFSLPHKRLFSRATPLVFIGTLGSTVLFMILALIFMRNQMRPVRRLAIAAEKFGRGQISKNLKPEGALEVRKAAKAFVKMQERIGRHIQQRTEMLAAISHDLRTPLTRMKLQTSMMQDTSEKEALEEDINQMERLIKEYLDFVRQEGDEEPVEISIDKFLQAMVKPFRRAGGLIKIQKNVAALPKLNVRLFPLERALGNLVQNGLQYGDQVLIVVDRGEKDIVVSIEDDGPGVPEEERKNIFRPFYRVDKSRNANTGGAGLGITIARDIIVGLGGHIELSTSSTLGGLQVRCYLPLE